MSKHPELTPLKSSAIKGFHYDPDSRVLFVQFPSGDVYRHEDVGIDKVDAMTQAASPGAYYNAKMAGRHGARKV